MRGIHEWSMDSPHKGPVRWKIFPFDYIIIIMHHKNKTISCHRTIDSNCNMVQSSKETHTAWQLQIQSIGWIWSSHTMGKMSWHGNTASFTLCKRNPSKDSLKSIISSYWKPLYLERPSLYWDRTSNCENQSPMVTSLTMRQSRRPWTTKHDI